MKLQIFLLSFIYFSKAFPNLNMESKTVEKTIESGHNLKESEIIEHIKTMRSSQLKELVETIETTFGIGK